MGRDKEGLIVGLVGAGLFVLLASLNIKAQGLYYDEVQQAPASFVLLGNSGTMITSLKWHRIPLLTITTTGAIKSIIYGLFLRLTNRPFAVVSWRLLGIFFVAFGLFIFCILTYKNLSRMAMLLFFGLILTDTTVLLTSRHDWGQTALPLALRLILLGVWVKGELGSPTLANSFFLGLLTGFSIYEKLVYVVLILPLLLVLLTNKARRTKGYWLVCALGVLIGALPLVLINAWSYIKFNKIYFILHKNIINIFQISTGMLIHAFRKYLELGNGSFVRGWILGNKAFCSLELLELISICIIVLSILIGGLLYGRKNFYLRSAMVMIFCYLAIWSGFILLRTHFWCNHIIIGTPFQYVGISLFWLGLKNGRQISNRISKTVPYFFIFGVTLLLLSRLPILASTELSLLRGDTASDWDLSYTKIAEFAASHQADSIFIAVNWGLSAQIYCLSNGQNNLVYVLYCDYDYNGLEDKLRKIMRRSEKKNVYLITNNRQRKNLHSANKLLITLNRCPSYIRSPLEPELKNLKSVKCIKYRYVPI